MSSTTSSAHTKSSRKGWILAGVGVIAVAGALTYWMGGSDESGDCEPVSTALLDAIESGLSVQGGGTLAEVAAIRSGDFERVWFVAGDIAGPGIEEGSEVGVWATNRNPEGSASGSIYSVNSKAMEFSDWGPGPGLSMSDDGAAEAEDCMDYV